jgi:hypothetical protein
MADAAALGRPDLLGRRAPTAAALHVYRAVTSPELSRRLLVRIPANTAVRATDLPRWDGLSITVEELDVAGVHGRFAVLAHVLAGTERVFEFVADDVCTVVESVPDEAHLWPALTDVLGRWRAFFEQHGVLGLSQQAQTGLYGELWLLHYRLEPRGGARLAIDGWRGYSRANHDFQLRLIAAEVKTTAGRRPLEVRISSERQLDDSGLEALYLAIVVVGVLPDGGETLPAIVGEIRQTVADDSVATAEFKRQAGTGRLS